MDSGFIMKILPFIIFYTAALAMSTHSLNLKCNFNNEFDFLELGNVYRCEVVTNPNITSNELTTITSVSGSHQKGMTNDVVLCFFASSSGYTIEYFPNGLELIFKNLKIISIEDVKLKKVHQSDLKPFPQLEFLCLAENDIETLEEDLFEFNDNLKLVMFYSCKISHIDPNIFDNLVKMTYLLLESNTCINENAYHDSSKVAAIVKKIQNGQCINPLITKKPGTKTEVMTTSTITSLPTSTESATTTDTYLTLDAKIDEIGAFFMDFVNSTNLKCKAMDEKLTSKCEADLLCQALNEKALNLEHLITAASTKISTDLTGTNKKVLDLAVSINDNYANLNEKVEKLGEKLGNLEENVSIKVFKMSIKIEKIEQKLENLERNMQEILQAVKHKY